jgi:hypothetical protein
MDATSLADALMPCVAVEGRCALGADAAVAWDAAAALLVGGSRGGAVVAWHATLLGAH